MKKFYISIILGIGLSSIASANEFVKLETSLLLNDRFLDRLSEANKLARDNVKVKFIYGDSSHNPNYYYKLAVLHGQRVLPQFPEDPTPPVILYNEAAFLIEMPAGRVYPVKKFSISKSDYDNFDKLGGTDYAWVYFDRTCLSQTYGGSNPLVEVFIPKLEALRAKTIAFTSSWILINKSKMSSSDLGAMGSEDCFSSWAPFVYVN